MSECVGRWLGGIIVSGCQTRVVYSIKLWGGEALKDVPKLCDKIVGWHCLTPRSVRALREIVCFASAVVVCPS